MIPIREQPPKKRKNSIFHNRVLRVEIPSSCYPSPTHWPVLLSPLQEPLGCEKINTSLQDQFIPGSAPSQPLIHPSSLPTTPLPRVQADKEQWDTVLLPLEEESVDSEGPFSLGISALILMFLLLNSAYTLSSYIFYLVFRSISKTTKHTKLPSFSDFLWKWLFKLLFNFTSHSKGKIKPVLAVVGGKKFRLIPSSPQPFYTWWPSLRVPWASWITVWQQRPLGTVFSIPVLWVKFILSLQLDNNIWKVKVSPHIHRISIKQAQNQSFLYLFLTSYPFLHFRTSICQYLF